MNIAKSIGEVYVVVQDRRYLWVPRESIGNLWENLSRHRGVRVQKEEVRIQAYSD